MYLRLIQPLCRIHVVNTRYIITSSPIVMRVQERTMSGIHGGPHGRRCHSVSRDRVPISTSRGDISEPLFPLDLWVVRSGAEEPVMRVVNWPTHHLSRRFLLPNRHLVRFIFVVISPSVSSSCFSFEGIGLQLRCLQSTSVFVALRFQHLGL